ncbi:helix-turn-helix transcriptional regulator [Paenibacillus agricola]|uniref:Helix-turn-helix transcriptional regulator n=1 Tax=Paenibacillus agricola TaxID=2716264 RepID=A0ABX0JI62_9BACL|nr:helix-turn-helix transcriptional regulator [Paenibacillus agricola]NHN33566.1 helix-turn-helix transcriptional regulator [Paenibacillus agricola]
MYLKTNVNTLNELLFRKGLTKRSFAQVAGIGQVTALQVCNGQRNPSAPVAKKIVDALQTDFDSLFEIVKGETAHGCLR